jgi:hypothetical protein
MDSKEDGDKGNKAKGVGVNKDSKGKEDGDSKANKVSKDNKVNKAKEDGEIKVRGVIKINGAKVSRGNGVIKVRVRVLTIPI